MLKLSIGGEVVDMPACDDNAFPHVGRGRLTLHFIFDIRVTLLRNLPVICVVRNNPIRDCHGFSCSANKSRVGVGTQS